MCARRSDDDLPASMFVVLVPCGQAKLAGSIRTWSDKPRRFRKETFLHDFRSGPDTLVGKGFIFGNEIRRAPTLRFMYVQFIDSYKF
jgi:hypothetical protein